MPAVINFPGGLNSWMGFAVNWGGYRAVIAVVVDYGIKAAIPLSITAGGYGGYKAGEIITEEITLTPAHLKTTRALKICLLRNLISGGSIHSEGPYAKTTHISKSNPVGCIKFGFRSDYGIYRMVVV